MGQREYEIGMLARLRPDEAAAKIVRAYRHAGGFNPAAAAELGIGVRTLERWVTRLGIRAQVDAIRQRAGHNHRRWAHRAPKPETTGRGKKVIAPS